MSARVHPKDLKILNKTSDGYVYSFAFFVPTNEIDLEAASSGYTPVFVDSKKNAIEINNVYEQLEELLSNPYIINPSIEIYYYYDDINKNIKVNNIILFNKKPKPAPSKGFFSYFYNIISSGGR